MTRKSALFIVGLLILLALFARFFVIREQGDLAYKTEALRIGEVGSEHTHMSIRIYINDTPMDLSLPEYQLQSPIVHTEDGDGAYIHKHATGVTLTDFLDSIKVKLTTECITFDTLLQYCSNDSATLETYLNREPFSDWSNYELRQGDKILITYGKDDPISLSLKLNSVIDLSGELDDND